ncbi:helix-turn-helix transcriptional regulator [Solibacillus sp. FSL H8-0523]|uniref:helix-turn-helix transcriptional regulator n=1 Tax=unclassified Solibacillus TaxID=2637870 RepID=UPI00310134BE
MEECLKNLKKAMDQTAFKKLAFTTEHEQNIRKQLQPLPLKQLLLSMLIEAKSGIELTQLLHVRGIEQIVDNEGSVYALLHEAEQQGWLKVSWVQGMKYYQLTKLGKNQLQQDSVHVKQSIKDRILGVRMHVE